MADDNEVEDAGAEDDYNTKVTFLTPAYVN